MKTVTSVVVAVVVIGTVLYAGCSKEDRADAIERVRNAGHALSGSDEASRGEPEVIRKAKAKEAWRQNKTWTLENMKKEPVLFLQDKLNDINKAIEVLETQIVALNTQRAKFQRDIDTASAKAEQAQTFLMKAKETYRAAEKTNAWPVTVNGYSLSQEQLKQQIVSAKRRAEAETLKLGQYRASLAKIESNLSTIKKNDRSRLEKMKSDAELKLELVKVQKATTEMNGLGDELQALQNQLDGLAASGIGETEPNLDDVMTPTANASLDSEFDAIMRD